MVRLKVCSQRTKTKHMRNLGFSWCPMQLQREMRLVTMVTAKRLAGVALKDQSDEFNARKGQITPNERIYPEVKIKGICGPTYNITMFSK